jgi:hypothetical protein
VVVKLNWFKPNRYFIGHGPCLLLAAYPLAPHAQAGRRSAAAHWRDRFHFIFQFRSRIGRDDWLRLNRLPDPGACAHA